MREIPLLCIEDKKEGEGGEPKRKRITGKTKVMMMNVEEEEENQLLTTRTVELKEVKRELDLWKAAIHEEVHSLHEKEQSSQFQRIK
jgi:hypothetical protein